MRQKKLIAILLVVLSVLLVFTACSYPDDGEPPYTAAPRADLPEIDEPSEPETTEPETEEPTEPPETEPPTEDPLDTEVQGVLSQLTTEEKVAQLFFVTPEALAQIIGPATVAGQTTQAAFDRYPVGGVLYMEQNLVTPGQTQELLSGMQSIGTERLGFPLFLAVDEEGGTVARISGNAAFGIDAYPNMSQIGEQGDPEAARTVGAQMGAYLRELGFNLDFAPVADVWTNPENTVVQYRAFSDDPETVTQMCAAFSEGLQSEGVLACYKHFPGHGATDGDSHLGAASSERTLEELMRSDLVPFLDAARQGIPFVMVGHITLPNALRDAEPASLSSEAVTELLRGKLGYQGIVITDALNMGAITQGHTLEEAAVQAILAGDDMLLLSEGLSAAYQAVLDAVEDGTISQQRLDESVARILRVKLSQLAEE